MLAKQYRLPAKEKLVNSKSIGNEFFRILTKPNVLNHNRFGFVVSKKIDKRAVVRNRLRRVLSEIVREFINSEQGKDILIVVKKNFFEVKIEEIKQSMEEALSKI